MKKIIGKREKKVNKFLQNINTGGLVKCAICLAIGQLAPHITIAKISKK